MSNYLKPKVILAGAGYMAIEYAKVLKALNVQFVTVGRGEESAVKFEQEIGVHVQRGGLNKFLASNDSLPDYAIIAVNAENLADSCIALLKCGVKNILLEKPGALKFSDFQALKNLVQETAAEVKIAYNRRFYSSTRKAMEYIQAEGGVTSFQFEFTEWLHVFEELRGNRFKDFLPYLFLANSTHVVDLAFFLGGKPKEISCYKLSTFPDNSCNSIFAGAGISDKNALFSYQANWLSPGRWSLEIMTKKHRFIFRPLEKLQIQQLKSVKVDFVEIDNNLDVIYKPGLFLQTQAFLEKNENFKHLCSFEEHYELLPIYQKISGEMQ